MAIKVMVVDDDPVIRALISEIVLTTGNVVEACESGAACLDALAVETPDLVVLDLQMPGMTGIDVLEKIRADEKTAALPVILLSANSDSPMIKEADVKADHYMQKPFDVKEFMQVIAEVGA